MAEDAASEHRPLVQIEPGEDTRMAAASPKVRVSKPSTTWAQKNQWVVLALASGACAALNGVFAKL